MLVIAELSVRVNEAGAEGRGVGEEQQLEKQQGEKEDEQVSCCIVREVVSFVVAF